MSMQDFFRLRARAAAEGIACRFDDALSHCAVEPAADVPEGFAGTVDDYLALITSLDVGVGLVETARASSNAAPAQL